MFQQLFNLLKSLWINAKIYQQAAKIPFNFKENAC
jgi:hypothetical protein